MPRRYKPTGRLTVILLELVGVLVILASVAAAIITIQEGDDEAGNRVVFLLMVAGVIMGGLFLALAAVVENLRTVNRQLQAIVVLLEERLDT